ncbi:MAG TPA: ATP-binding protein, partial [Planctomycetota bacterium]|nr:ATP-binding protein [Planctomycetota bacterium]
MVTHDPGEPREDDQRVFDLLPYGVIVTDRDGRVIVFNAHEERRSLLRREDVVGRNFFADIAPCTQVKSFQDRFVELMRDGRADDAAQIRFTFGPPVRPGEVDITFLRFEHRQEPLCLLLVRDVMGDREARDRIEQAKGLTAVGASAAQAAHSLRNVLANIVLTVEVLAQRAPDQRTRDLLLAMHATAFEGRHLIQRALGASRRTVHRGPVEVDLLMRSVIDMVDAYRAEIAEARGIDLRIEVVRDPGLQRIIGSMAAMREVLINLLRNAIEAMDRSGRILVAIDRVGDSARIVVRDEGQGMSHESLARAFSPLFTTKGDAGTGL